MDNRKINPEKDTDVGRKGGRDVVERRRGCKVREGKEWETVRGERRIDEKEREVHQCNLWTVNQCEMS